jgi:hypothetical protein
MVSARLHVQDGQYMIGDSVCDLVPPAPGGSSGLVGLRPGLAVVIAGTQFGNVAVSVEVTDAAPDLDTAGWDEVVEVSLTTSANGTGLGIISGGQGPGKLSGLTPAGPGSHRLRLHARGRDNGASRDVVTGKPVEEHLIQIWPGPAAPQAVHKTTDEYGRLMRAGTPAGSSRYPQGESRELAAGQPITATDRATAALRWIYVYAGGWLFELQVIADLAGLPARQEKRARRAVEGYEGAVLPGSQDARPLRVTLRYAAGRGADSAQAGDLDSAQAGEGGGAASTGEESRGGPIARGPVVSANAWTYYPDGVRHVAEVAFWSSPLPPPEPLSLTIEWPALSIPPATITIDGAAVAAAARTLPPLLAPS